MKTLTLISLAFFALSLFNGQLVLAQHSGNSNYSSNNKSGLNEGELESYILNDSTIELSVKAMYKVKATHYVAIFALHQVGETTAACNTTIDGRISSFVTALKGMGLSASDIHVDMVSLVPKYEMEIEKKMFSRAANEIPVGFEISKNVHIRYQADSLFSKIMIAAAANEIYDLSTVEYLVANDGFVGDSLRKVTLKELNRRTETFKAAGFDFNAKYRTVSEDLYHVSPPERYAAYTAFSSNSIENLKRKTVVTRADKQQTLYYKALSTNDFDVVINPVELEPAVQYVYILRVRFSLKRK